MSEMTVWALLGAIFAHIVGFVGAMAKPARTDDRLDPWPLACSSVAALLAAIALGLFVVLGPESRVFFAVPMPGKWWLEFDIFANGLATCFSLAISSLALLIFKFSQRYLRSDSSEKFFYAWGHLTVASVLAMTVAGNLALFGIFWLATSFSLHKLLTLYGTRPAAQFAAKKKFIISRVGDVCLVAAAILLYQTFATLNFSELRDLAGTLHPEKSATLNLIGALLVVGAMTKSAQVPFQSWLPETLEAPTPVSALMHAGVINAGGYLILRTYDLVRSASWAADFMCVVGILSVVVCGLTKLTTPDVKRRLAHSTSAQMGFMFLQLGLGVPGAALLHMLGHAFFKAHAFLTSGSLPVQQMIVQRSVAKSLLGTIAISALGLVPVVLQLTDVWPHLTFSTAVAISFLCIAGLEGTRLALVEATASSLGVGVLLIALGAAVAIFGGPFIGSFIGLSYATQGTPAASVGVSLLALMGFLSLFFLQSMLPQVHGSQRLRALYVLARNGFYFQSITRRVLRY